MIYARLTTLLLRKKGKSPVYLIHAVTDRCNAACGHCFVRPGTAGRELTVARIEEITAHLGKNLYQVCLTGGEPFLRDDLPGVAAAYLRGTTARVLQLSTNGLLTERITGMVQEIAAGHPARTVSVNLSLDGLGRRHDEIRGVPGLFTQALKTYHGLVKLQEEFPNLAVNVNVTVSKANQDHLPGLYAFLRQVLQVRSITATLARGGTRDPEAVQVDPNKYLGFARLLQNDLRSRSLPGYATPIRGVLVNAQNILARRRILATLRAKRRLQPCYAGNLSGVIDSSGGVRACELRPQLLGNLQEQTFAQIWDGPAAQEERRQIHSCYCTHECFLLVNIFFNLYYWPGLLKEAAWMLLRGAGPRVWGRERDG